MSLAVSLVTGHSFVTEQRSQAVIIKPMTRSLEHNETRLVTAAFARAREQLGSLRAERGFRLALLHVAGKKASISEQVQLKTEKGHNYGAVSLLPREHPSLLS